MKVQVSILLVIGAVLLQACGGGGQQQQEPVIKPIKYAAVAMVGGVQKRTFNGVSRSGSETNLSFRTNGLIVKINVNIGNRVKKGALLAQLDTKDIDLAYQQAKAALESAKTQMETSRSNLDRTKELYQAGSSSLNDYENAKNNFSNANSNYKTAQKALDLQRSQYHYARIVAPITGVVSNVIAEVNEYAQAGAPVIVMDSGDGNIEVNVGVPEVFISRISHGNPAEIKINGLQTTGTVTEVGFSASGSAVFPVIIQLNTRNNELRPGMPASATFTFGQEDNEQYLVAPIYAVGEDGEGNFVFLIEPEDGKTGVAKKQHIAIGELTSEGFKVNSGLAEGQLIATAGLQTLLDGQRVKL